MSLSFTELASRQNNSIICDVRLLHVACRPLLETTLVGGLEMVDLWSKSESLILAGWQLTGDMWTWHVPCDTRQVTNDFFFLSFFAIVCKNTYVSGIGATIHTRQEIQCLLYGGFARNPTKKCMFKIIRRGRPRCQQTLHRLASPLTD